MSKDLFTNQAEKYSKYRPAYPPELFQYILKFVAEKNTAWDCATGNGQSALGLAPHFKKVIATDISEKQLSFAEQHPNIQYQVCAAEQTDFPGNSFELVTVAQAYHWFRFKAFENEVRRVAKQDAVIAVWGYNLFSTNDVAIDRLIRKFYIEIVGPYWDAERKYVDDNCHYVPFSFTPLPTKDFFIKLEWTKEELIGYLNSWSSVQHFVNVKKYNPVDDMIEELDLLWKDIKTVSFPLFLKIGRVE